SRTPRQPVGATHKKGSQGAGNRSASGKDLHDRVTRSERTWFLYDAAPHVLGMGDYYLYSSTSEEWLPSVGVHPEYRNTIVRTAVLKAHKESTVAVSTLESGGTARLP